MAARLGSILCLVLSMVSVVGCSYTRDLAVLSRKQAIGDLDYLVKNLKAIHPEPFGRISEDQLSARFQQIKADLGDKTSRNDFSLCVAELLALIGDEHTAAWSFARPWVFQGSKRRVLPLELRYENGRMIIEDWTATGEPMHLSKGDTLIAVDGVPVERLLRRYRKYISAETQLQQNWEVAGRLPYLLCIAEGQRDSYEIIAMGADGKSYEQVLAAGQLPGRGGPSVEFTFEFYYEDRVCLLKAPSFWHTLGPTWEKTLDALFPQMRDKGTLALIADLRGNGGGNGGLGQLLIRLTTKKPFRTASKKWRYSKAYQRACLIFGLKQRRIPAWLHLERVLKLHDFPPYRDMVDVSKLQGEWLIPSDGDPEWPRADAWGGTLVLICDRLTASAAVDTVAIVKDNELGLIVGEETGGRASCFSEVAPLYLPNSGLLCQIASAKFVRPAGYDDGRGVLPDLPLDLTEKDSVLVEKIYNYIKMK
ncbi:MAG: S41 family peptidase [Planctomycetota bacterium]